MKSPSDTQTQELPALGVGNPACFELDERAPWPMPKANPTPQTAKDRITEPFKRWLEKMGTT